MAIHPRWNQIRKLCRALPAAASERKWGNVETYLIHRRMFFVIILDEHDKPSDCWLNAGKNRFLEVTDVPGFRPAPYMGRINWVATRTPQTLALAQWRDLIEHSYRQVASRLPLYRQRELGLMPTGRANKGPTR